MQKKLHYNYYESPIGLIEIGGTAGAILWLNFVNIQRKKFESHPVVDEAVRQIAEYFDRKRREFEIDISFAGTDFQKQVWRQLLRVPYGKVASYKKIATSVNKPKAVRAVGAANGRNPISIIVPCHRIIGSNGKLVGYGGGLWRKEWLLEHEGYYIK